MSTELLRLRLAVEADVFAVRQRVREAAVAVGFDTTDQVRLATAISEIGRLIVTEARQAAVVVSVQPGPPAALVLLLRGDSALVLDPVGPLQDTLAASRRLVDELVVLALDPFELRVSKCLPPGQIMLSPLAMEQLRAGLGRHVAPTAMDELRTQNQDLLRTLEELRVKQDELLRLNGELQETNAGVMAMYSQLSAELEETNRGVVALYAELDERGAQLRDANTAKSRFMAGVSHELRSPLNSVLALARLMREPDSEPLSENQRYQLGLMESSAEELLGLVNDLLDLAKAESGALRPSLVTVDVGRMLAQLTDLFEPTLPAGVRLVVESDPALPDLVSDPTLLTQLIRNLVANAVKFTEAGEVRVSAAVSASQALRITVHDTGIGIAPEHHERIFEEFYQVPGPLQRRSKSTGLGLPHARRVAEALGGQLTVQSTPGVGSTFTAELPIVPVDDRVEPETVSGLDIHLASVLVVDDDPQFRDEVRRLLAGSADRVVEAADADEGLRLMLEVRPDVVLLDLRMPGGGGETLLSRAASTDQLRGIPVAVLTSADLDASSLQRLSHAFTVLTKVDLTRASLLSAIATVVPVAQR